MSAELKLVSEAMIEAVEAPHWAPPEAPLDMPLQRLEQDAPFASLVQRLVQALMPRQRV